MKSFLTVSSDEGTDVPDPAWVGSGELGPVDRPDRLLYREGNTHIHIAPPLELPECKNDREKGM